MSEFQPYTGPVTPPGVPNPAIKPGKVQALAIMTLISGIVSIFWGIGVMIALLVTIVCWPIGIFNIVVGILEIIYAAKLLGSNLQGVKPATYLAILEIIEVLTANPYSLVVGILALVFYNDDEVKAWFASLAPAI